MSKPRVLEEVECRCGCGTKFRPTYDAWWRLKQGERKDGLFVNREHLYAWKAAEKARLADYYAAKAQSPEARERRKINRERFRAKLREERATSKVAGLGPSTPLTKKRKCHDCGRATWNYRCNRCRERFEVKHEVARGGFIE